MVSGKKFEGTTLTLFNSRDINRDYILNSGLTFDTKVSHNDGFN